MRTPAHRTSLSSQAGSFREQAVSFPHCLEKRNENHCESLEGTKYTWSPRSPKLEGTRPTGHRVRLRTSDTAEAWCRTVRPSRPPKLLYTVYKKVTVVHTRLPSVVPELIAVLGSQPAGDVSHKPGGTLPLLSARSALTPATLKRTATNFAAW